MHVLPRLVALTLAAGIAFPVLAAPGAAELARWKRAAERVTIMRDNWGIPHVDGKTDADAVFGMMYAQAEDDFHRVETQLHQRAWGGWPKWRARRRAVARPAHEAVHRPGRAAGAVRREPGVAAER